MEFTDIWVCVDCYWVHHYGEIHDHLSEDLADEDNIRNAECFAAYMRLGGNRYVSDNTDSNHLHIDECEFDCDATGLHEFSWSSCDCCLSTLGGSRYRLAVEDHEETE